MPKGSPKNVVLKKILKTMMQQKKQAKMINKIFESKRDVSD